MPLSLEFSFLITVVLTSRLALTSRDKALGLKTLIFMIVAQLVALTFIEISGLTAILAVVLVAINLAFYYLERKVERLNELRLLSLLVLLFALSGLTAPWASLSINRAIVDGVASLSNYFVLFAMFEHINWPNALITLSGLLLATSEANLFIRAILQWLNLIPKEEAKIDDEQYKAGRVIGILERIFIYYLVINSEFAAIGFVLAAKGIIRIRDPKDRPFFAEYVLIGTLLSALLAVLSAALVTALLAN